MESEMYLVSEGEITIKGISANGAEVEVTAEVENLRVTVERDMEDFSSFYAERYIPTQTRTYFDMKVKDKYTVKIIPPEQGVERTARVLALSNPEGEVPKELTLKHIKQAAKKAGVDENTEFITNQKYNPATASFDTYIEFRWTE